MKRSYKKSSFSERLLCVERFLCGESAKFISQSIGIEENAIPIYVAQYRKFGEAGLRKQPNIKASYSLKLQVVQAYHTKCLSLTEIIVKYGVSRSI